MAGTSSKEDLPFARELFEAADRMRGSVESAEYKHLVLGLLFLKYISDSFERRRAWLEAGTRDPANQDYFTEDEGERTSIFEDRDEYISENVVWVPAEARWEALLAAASAGYWRGSTRPGCDRARQRRTAPRGTSSSRGSKSGSVTRSPSGVSVPMFTAPGP
jgi:hypothetical protein